MTKHELNRWKRESIEEAYRRIAEEMQRVVTAAGFVN